MSLIAGLLVPAVDGRVQAVEDPPIFDFNGGTPVTPDGRLAISTALGVPSDVYFNGLRYTESGLLRVFDAPGVVFNAGFPQAGTSFALSVDELPVTGNYVAGVPLNGDAVCATLAVVPPPPVSGFSNGFDSGFGD